MSKLGAPSQQANRKFPPPPPTRRNLEVAFTDGSHEMIVSVVGDKIEFHGYGLLHIANAGTLHEIARIIPWHMVANVEITVEEVTDSPLVIATEIPSDPA